MNIVCDLWLHNAFHQMDREALGRITASESVAPVSHFMNFVADYKIPFHIF